MPWRFGVCSPGAGAQRVFLGGGGITRWLCNVARGAGSVALLCSQGPGCFWKGEHSQAPGSIAHPPALLTQASPAGGHLAGARMSPGGSSCSQTALPLAPGPGSVCVQG